MLNCLERFGWEIFYVFAGVEIMTISRGVYLPKCSKTHFGDPGAFWAFWGASSRAQILGPIPNLVLYQHRQYP